MAPFQFMQPFMRPGSGVAMVAVGDIGLIRMPGIVGKLIRAGQWLNGDGFSTAEHAVICVQVDSAGFARCVEAMPGGADERWFSPADGVHWSAYVLMPSEREAIAAAARSYLGTKYSALDYLALAAHRFRLPVPGLRRFIADSGHMICSQLADQAYLDAGIHLFADGRWPGYVTPGALRRLFLSFEGGSAGG